jgi:hypothetical protein
LIWILFLVLVAIGIAVLAWDIRRKTAAREAASKKRFEAMFVARQAPQAAPHAPGPAAVAAGDETKPALPAAGAPSARARFLGQPETLVYRLLRAGLPDHEVFANVAFVSVVGGRNEQEARRLSQYRLGFVICDKAMHVVAVVELEGAGRLRAAEQQFKMESLKAAGIRLVSMDAAALPRREEIRGLVSGQAVSAAPAVKE